MGKSVLAQWMLWVVALHQNAHVSVSKFSYHRKTPFERKYDNIFVLKRRVGDVNLK